MFVRCFILVLFFTEGTSICVKNKIKVWSPTKCEAGRTFFVRLSTVPDFHGEHISQPYLFPWLAELKIVLPQQVQFCSGALINDRYVLTAQNCLLYPIQADQVKVQVGYYNGYDKDASEIFQSRILERQAATIIPYPQYNANDPRTAAHNLALVKLNTPVKYSKTIYPIQLPTLGDKFTDYGHQLAENVEWSFISNYGTFKNHKVLKDNRVRILNTEQCGNFNINYRQTVTPGIICSINIENGKQFCGKENGGLITMVKPQRAYNITVLVGVTAWKPPNSCQDPSSPTIYVRIADKLEWIKANTRDGLYCRY